jgi:hypothetical protein
MKALAARPRDAEDIRQLAKVLDLHSADEILASVREVFQRIQHPRFCRPAVAARLAAHRGC